VAFSARWFIFFFDNTFGRVFCIDRRFGALSLIFRFGEVQRATLSAGCQ